MSKRISSSELGFQVENVEPYVYDNNKEFEIRFGKNLKIIRLDKKISQKEVARLLNMSFQQYQKYERGENRVSKRVILKLMDILDVGFHELIGQEDPSKKMLEIVKQVVIEFDSKIETTREENKEKVNLLEAKNSMLSKQNIVLGEKLEQISTENKALKEQLGQVSKENSALQKELGQVNSKMDKILEMMKVSQESCKGEQ